MLLLPLKLTIRRLSRDDKSVHVDAVVTDANDVSVRFMPIDMSPRTTPAEVVAILQSVVSNLAQGLHGRGEAATETEEKPTTEKDFTGLVGQTFLGSVAL